MRPVKRPRLDDSDESSMEEPQLVEIAKGGDLVVKAGKNKLVRAQLIQIHSICLKLASPVFREMLESSFVEGTTKYTVEKPLLLPDDYGPAFLEMCKILHHQPSQDPDLSVLRHLVILADKYQCIDSIRAQTLMTIGPYFSATTSGLVEGNAGTAYKGLKIVEALCIACIIDDAQLFHRISAVVILNSTATEMANDARHFEDLIPTDLIGRVIEYQSQLRRSLRESLSKPELKGLYMAKPCEGQLKAIGHYRHQLYRREFTRSTVALRTLVTEWQEIREVAKLHSVPIPPNVKAKDISCAKKCRTCPVDLKDEILAVVMQSKKDAIPLCLLCEKAATSPKLGVKCNHKFAR